MKKQIKKVKQIEKKIRQTQSEIKVIQNKIDAFITKTKAGKQTGADYLYEVNTLRPALKQLKNRLGQFRFRRNRCIQLSKRKLKAICFGGNKIAKARTTVYRSHEEWLKKYRHQRNKTMMITGRRQGKYGNNLFKYHTEEDVLVYRCSSIKEDIYLPVTFHKNKELLIHKVSLPHNTPGKAVAYVLEDHENYFIIKAIMEVEGKETAFNKEKGTIGIDINRDHIALCECDRHGNVIRFKNIRMDVAGKTTNQRMHIIRECAKEVSDVCVKNNKPLVIERLDFNYKKDNKMMYQNRKANRVLSEFAYKRITDILASRCRKEEVAIRKVDASYTSAIGRDKYMKIKGCSVHMAASYVIARRGMKLKD